MGPVTPLQMTADDLSDLKTGELASGAGPEVGVLVTSLLLGVATGAGFGRM